MQRYHWLGLSWPWSWREANRFQGHLGGHRDSQTVTLVFAVLTCNLFLTTQWKSICVDVNSPVVLSCDPSTEFRTPSSQTGLPERLLGRHFHATPHGSAKKPKAEHRFSACGALGTRGCWLLAPPSLSGENAASPLLCVPRLPPLSAPCCQPPPLNTSLHLFRPCLQAVILKSLNMGAPWARKGLSRPRTLSKSSCVSPPPHSPLFYVSSLFIFLCSFLSGLPIQATNKWHANVFNWYHMW